MKDFIKRNLKRALKIILLKFSIPIIVILLLLAAFVYFITLDDASHNDKDKTNGPGAVSKYTSNVTIGSDGKITSGMTANELWEEMKTNKNRALQYIDTPEQLLKLMNAELVTQYIDTRSNPDEPIDWESQKLNDINSNDIQGIIKLKRSDISGNNYTMKYTDPETFQSYIDKYNASGSEADRKTALSYFTLEASYIVSGGQAPTIEAGTTINVPEGLGKVHTYMGWQKITSTTSAQYKLRELAGMNFDEEGFGKINGRYVIACTATYGTVGDYIDFYQEDGSVIPCIIGDIKNPHDEGCNEWGHLNGTCIVEFVVDKNTWYNGESGGHANPGTSQCHPEWHQNITKAVNGGNYYDNPNFSEGDITANGNVVDIEENKDKNGEQKNDNFNVTKKYYAKVATWQESQTTVTSNDPNIPESTYSNYNMTTTSINYQDLVKGYTMPFDYLWTFLVMGENIDFVQELADLVYNSKMEVTVFDNLTTETDIMIDKYTARKKIYTSARVLINYGENSTNSTNRTIEDRWEEEKTNDYEVTQTTIIKTNTLNVALTLADVWMETYSQEYSYKQPTIEASSDNTVKLKNKNYGSTPDSIINNDTHGHAASLLEKNIKEYKENYEHVTGGIVSVESKEYTATTNREKRSINKRETTEYVSSPPNIIEKTDPEAEQDNFVKIMRKAEYVNTKSKIIEISGWLFEALETNKNTADMVDITKYLLYKVTGKNYGVKEYNFSEFSTAFDPIVDSSTGISAEGSRIVEIAKSKLGCQYVYNTAGPDTFDCSGFVYWVYHQVKISVPRSTDGYQSYIGSVKEISWEEAKPGDILLVLASERGTEHGHAGIYLGNDEYIHAPQTGDVVKISSNAKSKFKHVFRFYTESSGGGTAADGDGYSTTVNFNNRTYKEYKQSRGSYATEPFGISLCGAHGAKHIHSNGCGPTSVAIVASGYGKNYDPGDIARLMGGAGAQSSGNTISAVLNKIGIPSHSVSMPSMSVMRRQLESGKPFVVSVNGAMGNLFTKGGHLMAALAIDSKDNVFVSNPNPSTKNGWVPLSTLHACCGSKYAVFIDKK